MEGCSANHTFHNWAQTITCKPQRYCQPDTEQKVSALVKEAAGSNLHVRTVGAGHSWAPLVLTRDILVNLDKLTHVKTHMPTFRATAQAGIRLKDLTPRLAKDKLAMMNLGSIREQSIAGAISTGTHGTGLGFGNLATQIVGMKLVTGTGDVLTITENDTDMLNAARVSLGALGIITEVTIQCVPHYNLEYSAYWCKFNDVVDQLDTLNQENARLRLWWLVPPIGGNNNVIVTTLNPPGTPPGILGKATNLITDIFHTPDQSPLPMDTNGLFNTLPNLAAKPGGFNKFLNFTGPYDSILTVPLVPVLHRECEYAVPTAKAPDALRAVMRAIEEGDLSLTLPIEVRFVGGDNSWLSPAFGRKVCYIGAATQPNANEVFDRVEPIMKSLGGRPHWGKCFSLTRKELQEMYPETWGKFKELRQKLDPKGVFANEFMRQMFD